MEKKFKNVLKFIPFQSIIKTRNKNLIFCHGERRLPVAEYISGKHGCFPLTKKSNDHKDMEE